MVLWHPDGVRESMKVITYILIIVAIAALGFYLENHLAFFSGPSK